MSDDDKVFDEFEQYCDETAKLAAEWEKRWPNACKRCYGRGGSSYIEMHGFKHGAGEQMWDTCDCVEHGDCPRCGVRAWDDGEEWTDQSKPCAACGWNWGKGEDDACPEI